MYASYYKLRALPFELTSHPDQLFLSPSQRESLSNIIYGLASAKALTVLTGRPGTGKTTIVQAALTSEHCRGVRAVYLNNPALTRNEFITTLGLAFALPAEVRHSKPVLLASLEQLLKDRAVAGQTTALIVDEAQALTTEVLEEIRLLANMEAFSRKLLPLVLAGQPEFALRLQEPALSQLKQRVALRCEIVPFSLNESAGYIASRIRAVGGAPERLFTREAVAQIHRNAGGIARTINVICDNALITAMALGQQTVDPEIVSEVCKDFGLTPVEGGEEGRSAAAPEAPAGAARSTLFGQEAADAVEPARSWTRVGETLRLGRLRR